MIFRNTHPAVWEGDLADRVRQELDRRSWYIRGKAVPSYTHRLSGLAVCGECGNFMSTFVSKGYRRLYCSATKGRTFYTPCNSRGVTNERQVIARMNEFLSQMLHENKTDIFAGKITNTKTEPARISGLEAEISQLEEQARSLI